MRTLVWGLGGSLAVALLSAAMQIVVPRAFVYLVDRLDHLAALQPVH